MHKKHEQKNQYKNFSYGRIKFFLMQLMRMSLNKNKRSKR